MDGGALRQARSQGVQDPRFTVNATDVPPARGILERKLPDFMSCTHEMDHDNSKAFHDFALTQRNFDRTIDFVIASDAAIKQLEVCLVILSRACSQAILFL